MLRTVLECPVVWPNYEPEFACSCSITIWIESYYVFMLVTGYKFHEYA